MTNWPEGLTRERLELLAADNGHCIGNIQASTALRALAAIAPSVKPETSERWVMVDLVGDLKDVTNWTIRPEGALLAEVPVLPRKPRTMKLRVYQDKSGNLWAWSEQGWPRVNKEAWTLVGSGEIPLEA